MNKPLINPYTVGPPVTGGSFYGREKLLSQIERSLRSTNVVLLQGQRRIGKTSFLRQLAHYLSKEQPEISTLPIRVPILFDIQRYVQDTLPQFQLHLAGAITRAMGLYQEESLPVQALVEWEADSTLFQDKWLPQLCEKLSGRELVILVDEFDNFDEQIAPQAMQTLIPFLGQLVSGESRLRWVFTLGRLSSKMSLEYDPIMRLGEGFRLACLTSIETRKLIVKPAEAILNYQPKAIERIYKLTSGQPHLTQAICSKIFEQLIDEDQKTVTVEAVDTVVSQTLEAYGSAIASIVSAPPIEGKVLAAVAQLTNVDETTTRNQIIELLINNSVRLSREDLINAIKSLSEWELVKGNTETLQIKIKLVQSWLFQNRLVEPTQQETLNIQHALAQSRFEFAEQARRSGQYELSIKDYKEALEYIPGNVKALQGLAEAYRLNNNLSGRTEILRKLYLYDKNILNEMIDALIKYAQECEEVKDFSAAAKQYEYLLAIQNRADWQQKDIRIWISKFENQICELEEKLLLYKQTDFISLIDERDEEKRIKRATARERISTSDAGDTKNSEDDTSSFITEQINQSNSEKYKAELAEELRLPNGGIVSSSELPTELKVANIKTKLLKKLERICFDLINTRQKIESKLEVAFTSNLDFKKIETLLKSLILKESNLLNQIKIEQLKIKYDPEKAALVISELKAAGESLSEADKEQLDDSAFAHYISNSTIILFKALIFILFSISYIAFMTWLVKDWYIKAFIAAVTGFLIILAIIIPIGFYALMDEGFNLLTKRALRIVKRFRPFFSQLYFKAHSTKPSDF